MKKLFAFIFVFSLPACGVSDDKVQIATEKDQAILFALGNSFAKVIHKDIESEEQCPVIELLSINKDKKLSTKNLCQVKIPGYRELHALKDFAYIEFSHYRLQKPSTILYDIDLAILQGSAFEVTCRAEIKNDIISIGECIKIE